MWAGQRQTDTEVERKDYHTARHCNSNTAILATIMLNEHVPTDACKVTPGATSGGSVLLCLQTVTNSQDYR